MPAGEEERARSFYRDLLGLKEAEKPDALVGRGGCWFERGDLRVHLGVEADFRAARKAHPAFLVDGLDGLDGLRARLEAAGAETSDDVPVEGLRRFHAFDPFGNRLEFVTSV